MRRKSLLVYGLWSMVFCLWSVFAFAMGGNAPKKATANLSESGGTYLIDNFESGNLHSPRDWWTFDIKTADIASNQSYRGGA
ncbi:MAG: hypothetical protein QME05_04805, partial [Candidatus Margulisbacteria bacterium]|nr:hypothetical protein [Candidatus Margulisiibacteriota bacterium]